MIMKRTVDRKSDGDPQHRTLRHAMLLAVLLTIILLGPLFGATLNTIIFLIAMAVVAALLDGGKKRTRAAITIMVVPAITLIVVQFLPPGSRWKVILLDDWPTYIFQVVLIVALGYCGWLVLSSLLDAHSVSANEILGAISFYLILAFIWSFSYDLLERAEPGSFKLLQPMVEADVLAGDEEVNPLQFIYFSLVTQSSVGYGDITPRSTLAQRLAVLQAVMGQFYMAVVVAYLISLLMMQRRE